MDSPRLHGFYKWVFDTLGLLHDFVKHLVVVVVRRDSGLQRWACWLREDLSSGPHAWLRPDVVPPSLFWLLRMRWPRPTRSWLSPISSMLSSVKPGYRSSAGLVTQWLLQISSWISSVPLFLTRLRLNSLGLLGRISWRWLGPKDQRQVVWMGGPGEIKALPLAWFSGLAIILKMVESIGNWPGVCWMRTLP